MYFLLIKILAFVILGGVFGSLLAWFGRELIDKRGWKNVSACDSCRRKLYWWELIPIFSYMGLGGKCRSCGVIIKITVWSMELIGALLFGLGAWRFTDSRDLIWWIILAGCTMLLFYIDLRWMVVPRAFSVIVAFVVFMAQWSEQTIAMVLLSALLGAICYFFMYAISNGQWVGNGDVGLGFIVGASVGSPIRLGLTLLLAHIFGAVVAVILLKLKKKQFGDSLPIGAFLLPAMWVVLLWFGWL